jgi:CRP-like cAMP-binding protein
MSQLNARVVEGDVETEALMRLRYEVYVEEFGMTSEADHVSRQLRDRYDDHARNYALFDGDEIVGSLRAIRISELPDPSEFMAKFELRPAVEAFGADHIVTTSRFIISPRHRLGTGIFRLMQEVFLDALGNGVRLNYGDCSPHLLPFYEQMGYRRYTAGYNDTEYGFKLPIMMVLRDRDYLKTARSPLLRLVDESADDPEARDWFTRNYPLYVAPPTASFMAEERFLEFLADRIAGDPAHHMVLLKGMSPDEQQRFLSSATTLRINPGDRVVRRGERDNTLFAVMSGIAEVVNPADGPPLAVFGPGDTFGEIGFLAGIPRTADVIARTHGEILVLSGEFLEKFLRQKPEIASKVLFNLSRELAGRLAEMNERDVAGSQAA